MRFPSAASAMALIGVLVLGDPSLTPAGTDEVSSSLEESTVSSGLFSLDRNTSPATQSDLQVSETSRYVVVLEDPSWWEQFVHFLNEGEMIDVLGRGESALARSGARVLGSGELSSPTVAIYATPEVAQRISDSELVQSVFPDETLSSTVVRREVGLTSGVSPWGLDRLDQQSNVLDGRYHYSNDGSGVTVYVLDTGLNTTDTAQFPPHRTEAYAVWDVAGISPRDCDGHGTHVAGTIAGETLGVASGARLVSFRLTGWDFDRQTFRNGACTEFGTVDLVLGMLDTYDHWIDSGKPRAVMNLSLGGPANSWVDEEVRWLSRQGMTIVAAAGNASPGRSAGSACDLSPARSSHAITVGATGRTDRRTSWSYFGRCVDLFAPGENIPSAHHQGGVVEMSGTSMAAPHVAGIAARYLQANRRATPAAVKNAIIEGAISGVSSRGSGSPNRLANTLFMEGSSLGSLRLPTLTGLRFDQEVSERVRGRGGLGPLSYEIVSGDLPFGLSMDEGGHITGTVNDYGSGSVRVRVTDAVSRQREATLRWVSIGRPDLESALSPDVASQNRILRVTLPQDIRASYVERGSALSRVQVRARVDGSTVSSCQVTANGRGNLASSCLLSGLRNGSTYDVQMRARNAAGWSPWTVVVTAEEARTPMPVAPARVGSVRAVAGAGQVAVSWRAPSSDGGAAVRYSVERRVGDGEWGLVVGCEDLSRRTLSCVDRGEFEWGELTQYRVRAANFHAESGWRNSSTVTPFASPQLAAMTPTSLDVNPTNRRLTVTWGQSLNATDVNRGRSITRVQVQARASGQTSRTCDVRLSRGNLPASCAITSLANGVSYDLRMRVWNEAGRTGWFNLSLATAEWQRIPGTTQPARWATDSTLAGQVALGETLTVEPGEAIGRPEPEVSIQWLRCSSTALGVPGGGECLPIPGANDSDYVLSADDVGSTVIAEVIADNGVGVDSALISLGARVPAAPIYSGGHEFIFSGGNPLNAPVEGFTIGSNVFFGQPGWVAYPAISALPTGDWLRCDSPILEPVSDIPTDCLVVSDQAMFPYRLGSEDVGKYVTARITVGNSLGQTTLVMPTPSATATPLVMLEAPDISVSGAFFAPNEGASGGGILSLDAGKWSGFPEPDITVEWIRCNGTTDDLSVIGCVETGMTGPSYELSHRDIEWFVTARVTATNALGTLEYVVPQLERPAFTPYPLGGIVALQGNDGSPEPTLSFHRPNSATNVPTWQGHPAATVVVTWFVCDSPQVADVTGAVGDDCVQIPGAPDDTSFTAGAAQYGKHVIARITGSNDFGSHSIATSSAGPIYTRETLSGEPVLSGPGWIQHVPPFGINASSHLGVELTGIDSKQWGLTGVDWYVCDSRPGDEQGRSGLREGLWAGVPNDCDLVPSNVSDLPDWVEQGPAFRTMSATIGKYVLGAATMAHQTQSGGSASLSFEVWLTEPVSEDLFSELTLTNVLFFGWHRDYELTKPGDGVGFNLGHWHSRFPTCSSAREWEKDYCVDFEHTWLRNGQPVEAPLRSSTSSFALYEVSEDDMGSVLSIRYRISHPGFRPLIGEAIFPGVLSTGVFTNAPEPTILGTNAVGETLTVDFGTWDAGVEFATAWLRDGSVIAGAQGSSYTLTADDLGKTITARVTGSKRGYDSVTHQVSLPSVTGLGTLTNAPTPTVWGTNSVGNALNANLGTWDQGVTFTSMNWYRDGNKVGSGSWYSLVAEDLGRQISFRVVGSKPGYREVVREVFLPTLTVAGTLSSSPTPTVFGSMEVDNTLSASPGTWDPGVTFRYQWLRSGSAISGATSASYKLQVADVGSTISVRVTGSKPGYTSVTRSRTVSGTVGVGVAVVGTNVNGTTQSIQSDIRASHIESDSLAYEYQWYVCSSRVWGASTTLPAGCSLQDTWGIPALSQNRQAFLSHNDGGAFILVGLKATYGSLSTWRYSASTGGIVTPPLSVTAPNISVSSDIAADTAQGWSGFTYEACFTNGTCETRPRQANIDRYSHWRIEGQVTAGVNRGSARSHPSSSVQGHRWYVCTESVDPFIRSRVATQTLQFGVSTWNQLPGDCEDRGTSATFTPTMADAGKYPAVLVTHRNSFFQTTVFHRTNNPISFAPQIRAAEGALAPQITGAAELGETLTYEAEYLGFPEPESDLQWYRCKRAFPDVWRHDVPLDNASAENLVSNRKIRIIPGDFFLNNGCSEIPEANGRQYTLTEEDRGLWMVVFDTAANDVGSSSVFTASSPRVEYPPYLFVRTNSSGEMSPSLRCYTSSLTNSFCRQDSSYRKGSVTTVRTFTPADTAFVDNNTSWIFRGRPTPELVQKWWICDSNVAQRTELIPSHCRQVESMPDRPSIYQVNPADWGSWVVTTYTATNRLGSLTMVGASRYLWGEPYMWGQGPAPESSLDVTGATVTRGEGVADTSFVVNFSGHPPAVSPSQLTVDGVTVQLVEVVDPDSVGDGSITWSTSDRGAFSNSTGNLTGSFSWDGRVYELEFDEWAPPGTPPASIDDVPNYPSGLALRGDLDGSTLTASVFTQEAALFAPGSVVRFYSYPGATLVAKVVADLDGNADAEAEIDQSIEALVAVGIDSEGDELVRSVSVELALTTVTLTSRIEGSGNDAFIVLSWEDLDPQSGLQYAIGVCHPLDEFVTDGSPRPADCRDGDGFILDPEDENLSDWVRSSTEVAFRISELPWYGDEDWSWIIFAVSIYDANNQLVSGINTPTNWLGFSQAELDQLANNQ